MILFSNFSSETSWLNFTKFHVDPTVEMGLRVCSNGHASLTVMPIYGKIIKKHSLCSRPITAQNDDPFINCNDRIGITFAYLQWLLHSGERAVACGPLALSLKGPCLVCEQ